MRPGLCKIYLITMFLFLIHEISYTQTNLIRRDSLLSFLNYEEPKVSLPPFLDSIFKSGRTVPISILNFSQVNSNIAHFIRIDNDSLVEFLSTQFQLLNSLNKRIYRSPQVRSKDTVNKSNTKVISWCQSNRIVVDIYYCGKIIQSREFQSHLFFIEFSNMGGFTNSSEFFYILNTNNNNNIQSYIDIAYLVKNDIFTYECKPTQQNDDTFFCEDVTHYVEDTVIAGQKPSPTKNDPCSKPIHYYMKFKFDEHGFVRLLSN
jgi:hypothetical protein